MNRFSLNRIKSMYAMCLARKREVNLKIEFPREREGRKKVTRLIEIYDV